MSEYLLEEFIKVLERPQSLSAEKRFELLEKAYISRYHLKLAKDGSDKTNGAQDTTGFV